MNPIDLIVFAGQSNMAGRGCTQEAAVCPAEAGFEYRAVSAPGKLFSITEPFGRGENRPGLLDDSTKKTGSMVSSFIKTYHRLSGRGVVAISASKGGTSSGEWADTLAADAAARLKSALAHLASLGVSPAHVLVLFCQGETDGDLGVSAAQYRSHFESVWAQLRGAGAQRLGLIQIGHFNKTAYPQGLYGLTGEQLDARYETIRQEQLRIAQQTDGVFLAASFAPQENAMKDEFHYLQRAYDAVGEEAAQKTAEYIQNCDHDT